ncbi:hypothetical protein [Nocardioides sp. YIM 152315]|uniref:hypothetical protein n=1 Tax=Nocardioides sp. YIM 152315 TaxID=3031760 RepID=UPI0023DB6B69|nr:hypothetical protein [Nocardioides sp. YIM 152315]MDF1604967.1 hypothetical protein [Nocardioides sp. YIM 152315]
MPEGPALFPVQVRGLERLRAEQVVYHGVNKSGSMAMTEALFGGFDAAGRADEFVCTYRGAGLRLIRERLARPGRGFFAGHYLYGDYPVHPERQVLLTGFRNPLPRARSCYQWLSDKAERADPGGPFPPFVEWVRGTRGVDHSQMSQFAVGFGPDAPHPSTVPPAALLERAMAHVERDVAWFGIAEHFEESVLGFASICGLPAVPAWHTDMRNAHRPLLQEWTQEEIDVVHEVCTWDIQLYEWALGRFRAQVDAVDFGDSLAAYRDACRDQYKDRVDLGGRPLSAGAGPDEVAELRDTVRRLRVQAAEAGAREVAARAELAEVTRKLAWSRKRIARLRRRVRALEGAEPDRRRWLRRR